MRLLKLYDGDYPWDVRVEKMLRTLVGAGHEVTLVARNRKGLPRRETHAGVALRRLPSLGRAGAFLTVPAFVNPIWIRAALRAAQECRPERVIVRDLPLAPLGVWLAQRLGCPAIVDMAEPYPEALRSNWQFDELGGLDHVLRSPRLAELVERWVLRRSPRVLVVSPESGERLERLGLGRARWTLVGNTPDLSRLETHAVASPALPRGLEGRPLLIFTGILVGDRGLDVAISGLAALRERRPRPALLVIGDGPARARYESEVRARGVGDDVRFLGWVQHDELPGWLARADVGILPFHACTHIHTTLANKLFDYMALGLPVLASDARPMVRVLEETRAGVTFRAGDAADFARAAAALLADPAGRRAMGECGRKAVRETYQWGRDAERLLAAVAAP
jgi:glycosyltransferase involved in cell wall biosynthesis